MKVGNFTPSAAVKGDTGWQCPLQHLYVHVCVAGGLDYALGKDLEMMLNMDNNSHNSFNHVSQTVFNLQSAKRTNELKRETEHITFMFYMYMYMHILF